MGFPTDATGTTTSTIIQPLQLPTNSAIQAKQTTALTAHANLDARAPLAAGSAAVVGPPAVAAVLPTPRTTYGTSMAAYDGQGVALPINLFFSKVAPATPGTDQWAVYDSSAAAATPIGSLVFDAAGTLTGSLNAAGAATATPLTLDLTLTPASPSIVPAFPVTLNLSKVTQFGTSFAVTSLSQDGYPPGDLTSLKVGEDGVVTARYSNGQTQASGKLAMADFRNVQGLAPSGGGNWVETLASGQPVQGSAGQGKFGKLTAGALEESNVDLTAELVNMMTAQRAYQANAQTIKTQDQMMQSIVNLR
jgi:flagellar hook protein FlgE